MSRELLELEGTKAPDQRSPPGATPKCPPTAEIQPCKRWRNDHLRRTARLSAPISDRGGQLTRKRVLFQPGGGQADVELALFGEDNPELAIGEIDRHFLERADGVHAQQKRRLAIELQLLERMRVGEHNRQIPERQSANVDFPHEHIVAG